MRLPTGRLHVMFGSFADCNFFVRPFTAVNVILALGLRKSVIGRDKRKAAEFVCSVNVSLINFNAAHFAARPIGKFTR